MVPVEDDELCDVASFSESGFSNARPNIRAEEDFKFDCVVLGEVSVCSEVRTEGIPFQLMRLRERHVQTIKE